MFFWLNLKLNSFVRIKGEVTHTKRVSLESKLEMCKWSIAIKPTLCNKL
jgi:hypothetical protein